MGNDLNQSKPSSPRPGLFDISCDRRVSGTVTIAGRDTRLYVWDDSILEVESGSTIFGVLDDLTKISLVDCYVVDKRRVQKSAGERFMYNVLPQFVIVGEHLSRNDRSIDEIAFNLRDVSLFNDSDAFGTSFFNEPDLLQQIAQSDDRRLVDIEEWNWIRYYTGKTKIFSTDTVLGQIVASHTSVFHVGISVDEVPTGDVFVSIRPCAAVTVVEALTRMETVLQFFDVIVGRSQFTREIRVYTGDDRDRSYAEVSVCVFPDHRLCSSEGSASPLDILIDPVKESGTFSSVLTEWLKRDKEWGESRSRLSPSWCGMDYNEDRVVRAANAFDLVPNCEFAGDISVSSDMQRAVRETRTLFKSLPVSDERDSVLGALGRVGEWNLKRKIRYRERNLIDAIGESLPELGMVTDEAVNFRNYYVHGSPPRVLKEQVPMFLVFLTDSLEFVFTASDLVDAGWDIRSWCSRPKPMGHPFHNFLSDYCNRMKSVEVANCVEEVDSREGLGNRRRRGKTIRRRITRTA